MRRLFIGAAVILAIGAYLLTTACGYILIEHTSGAASVGPRTYKLESAEQ